MRSPDHLRSCEYDVDFSLATPTWYEHCGTVLVSTTLLLVRELEHASASSDRYIIGYMYKGYSIRDGSYYAERGRYSPRTC